MNATEAFYESSRCLFCYDAPCVQACPTQIDIPLFIKQIHTQNIEGAAKTIFETNWLGNTCGKVCPTSELCEGACVFDGQNVPVIQIGRLQNFATDQVIKLSRNIFRPGPENGQKIAIIGSGPAGIASACELRTLGYTVTIFEAKERPSGLAIHGVAPYKITNQEVLAEVDYLKAKLGFEIRYRTPLESKDQLERLESEYDAIFLGIGLGETASLNLPGENKENVVGAVEFVEELREKHHTIEVPNRVIVIGGGNTAMDAASEAARMGAGSVILAYRRSKMRMGAYIFEYELAKSVGAVGLFSAAPLAILGESQATGVKFIRTEEINGVLKNVPESEFDLDCDLVIKATGQSKQADFLLQINGIKLDNRNRIIVNPENQQTSNPIYFAGGDVVNGGAEVVNAAYEGKVAARGIHRWLQSDNLKK